MTNVNEDGTIPVGSKPNWSNPGLNNCRQNKQPDSEFGAPDAIVAIEPLCQEPDKYSLVATVTRRLNSGIWSAWPERPDRNTS